MLETERLILRRFTPTDAEAMFRNWASDPEVTKFMTWQTHDSIETTRKVIESWVDGYKDLTKYEWAIVLRSLDEPIGSIAAMGANDDLRSVEIGYNIGIPWWGNGYTAEALICIVKFLFEEVGFNRIVAKHEPHNPNSGAVMRKAGMKLEAFRKQAGFRKQAIYDHCEYAILAEDYFGNTQKRGVSIGGISIDCANPIKARDFYATFTGWEKREAYGCPALVGDNGLLMLFTVSEAKNIPHRSLLCIERRFDTYVK